VLLRLAYLGVANASAMLRLLTTSDREKDVEILALRIRSRRWSGNRARRSRGFTRAIRDTLGVRERRI